MDSSCSISNCGFLRTALSVSAPTIVTSFGPSCDSHHVAVRAVSVDLWAIAYGVDEAHCCAGPLQFAVYDLQNRRVGSSDSVDIVV